MVISTDRYWFAHSDVRGPIYNLEDGGSVELPHQRWPRHLFIVAGLSGSVEVISLLSTPPPGAT